VEGTSRILFAILAWTVSISKRGQHPPGISFFPHRSHFTSLGAFVNSRWLPVAGGGAQTLLVEPAAFSATLYHNGAATAQYNVFNLVFAAAGASMEGRGGNRCQGSGGARRACERRGRGVCCWRWTFLKPPPALCRRLCVIGQ